MENALVGTPAAIASLFGRGSVNAIAPRPTAIHICMVTVHQRLVRKISTMGLQKGLITQGMYSQPVYSAASVSDMPSWVNNTIVTILMKMNGMPWAK